MKLTADALVIWEHKTGEADRVITLLTANGVVSAYAKNSLRPKNKLTSATAMLTYANFELYSGKNMYTVDEAVANRKFIRLSADVLGYSLAAYFCELLKLLAPVEDDVSDFLSLTLNALHLLDAGKKPLPLVKAVFELRAMLYAGYLPDLTACAECGAQDAPAVHFDLLDGVILCESCARKQGKALNCRRAVLSAMRHILYAEPGRAFSFELGDEAMRELSDLAERYVVTHIERTPATLDFYHSLQ